MSTFRLFPKSLQSKSASICSTAIVLILIASGCSQSKEPIAGMGIMTGEVTDRSALVQVRLTIEDRLIDNDVHGMPGLVEFTLTTGDGKTKHPPQIVHATAERDFIARASWADLQANTEYRCKTRTGTSPKTLREGPSGTFKTHPGPTSSDPVEFVVVTGMNYAKFHGDNRIDGSIHLLHNATELPKPYSGKDKKLGYPALKTLLDLKPDFFVGTGDTIYYDTPKEPRAETTTQMRQKWHEQFIQPRFHDLFAEVPTFWEVDDHDYRIDDGDNSGDYDPSPELARRILMEQLPIAPAENQSAKTYRTHRINKDLQIWFMENRIYRSPNAMTDGPEKSIWGTEQKAWLKRTLVSSNATFKIMISPTPMIGPDSLHKTDNHADIGGFQTERDEFFSWLIETGLDKKHFYIVCGDRHWQYHSISPEGIEEFSSGALTDTNSRLGVNPGDPNSTDPQGTIKQAYTQNPRSGGFLLVRTTPTEGPAKPKLTFDFRDEHGIELYQHTKTDIGNPQEIDND
ncbi:MAG: alkaline phosphatase D family protein [Opitutaceae bacterium]|nr:alkaline phosphatase D family protein [Opitutaceae bacterium]